MADQTTPPAKPEAADKKDDKAPDGFALPKNQQLTTGQQVFIWGLVLFVGVLFGAGPITDTLLGNTDRVAYVGNISQHDIMARQGVARRLQDVLNPNRDPAGDQFEIADRFGRQNNTLEAWAERIKLARYAESQGLLPRGEALKDMVKEFLNRPLPGNPAKRYADALQEVQGGEKGVTVEQVGRHLAEERARDLLTMARIVAPVVPVAMGDAVSTLGPPFTSREDYFLGAKGDQVVLDEVVLSAKHLLPEVKDDDAGVQAVYDRLRNVRFNRPAALETTIVYADVAALAAKTAVADSDIEAYYNAHKDDYRKPVDPPKPEEKKADEKAEEKKPEEPKVEFKALAEVSAQIKDKLARERAELQAKELVRQFDATIEASDLLHHKDNAAFKDAAAKAGLTVREKVFIEEPKAGGTLDAGEFGMLSESQLHLFNQELHFITSAVQSTGDKASWIVLRIDGRRDAGFRDLGDPAVKAEVKAVLAGERAYKDLLAKAEEIRAAAEKAGPGGLKKWAESDAAKPWEAKAVSKTESVVDLRGGLTEVRPPATEPGGLSNADGRPLIALAMPEHPVALGDAPAQGDVPAVRLVQTTDYKPADPAAGAKCVERANAYRSMLQNYRFALFQRELAAELQKD